MLHWMFWWWLERDTARTSKKPQNHPQGDGYAALPAKCNMTVKVTFMRERIVAETCFVKGVEQEGWDLYKVVLGLGDASDDHLSVLKSMGEHIFKQQSIHYKTPGPDLTRTSQRSPQEGGDALVAS